MLTNSRYIEIAKAWCDLFEKYSVDTPIDRLLPEYRVANDDITQLFPDFTIHDKEMLLPFVKAEMRRRGLTFKRR